MAVSMKSYFNFDEGEPEIRRFTIPQDVSTSYLYLLEKIQRVYPSLLRKNLQLYWQDEDGDLVTFSSDDELITGLENSKSAHFKVYVRVKDEDSEQNKKNNGNAAEEHIGVVCDICDSGIKGTRFKCMICPDYDLCGKCESQGFHSEHGMIRIRNPGNYGPWSCGRGRANGFQGFGGRSGCNSRRFCRPGCHPYPFPGFMHFSSHCPPFPHCRPGNVPPFSQQPEAPSEAQKGDSAKKTEFGPENVLSECLKAGCDFIQKNFPQFEIVDLMGQQGKETDNRDKGEPSQKCCCNMEKCNVEKSQCCCGSKEKCCCEKDYCCCSCDKEKCFSDNEKPCCDEEVSCCGEGKPCNKEEPCGNTGNATNDAPYTVVDREVSTEPADEIFSPDGTTAENVSDPDFVMVDDKQEDKQPINEDEKQETEADPFQQRLNEAVAQMEAMGFRNDDGWLTQLLVAKDCDVGRVVNTILPQGRLR